MSHRPLIGVTCDANDARTSYTSPCGYTESILRAGGLPVILPYRADPALVGVYLNRLDGMLFTGGDDLDPAAYGEAWHPQAVKIDPLRERFERALIAEAERRGMPILGICLGSQLMNLHRGGSMHQFLPDLARDNPLEHRNLKRDWIGRHAVRLNPESTYARAIGQTEIVVNTSHKQAINRVGRGLRVLGTATDGVIEGVEDPSLPMFIGVQWHAERIIDQPEQLWLFERLVAAAAG
jgi:putative glutamine amidotransferase